MDCLLTEAEKEYVKKNGCFTCTDCVAPYRESIPVLLSGSDNDSADNQSGLPSKPATQPMGTSKDG